METETFFPQEEIVKIKNYLESGDKAKAGVADAKIDKFILAYLKDLKYNEHICKLETALSCLEKTLERIMANDKDNPVLKLTIDKFREFVQTRTKINYTTSEKEKQELIRQLKSRNLYEI